MLNLRGDRRPPCCKEMTLSLFKYLAHIRLSAYSNSTHSSPGSPAQNDVVLGYLSRFVLRHLSRNLPPRPSIVLLCSSTICLPGSVRQGPANVCLVFRDRRYRILWVFLVTLCRISCMLPLPSANFPAHRVSPQTRFPDFAPWGRLPRHHGRVAAVLAFVLQSNSRAVRQSSA